MPGNPLDIQQTGMTMSSNNKKLLTIIQHVMIIEA